MKDRERPEIGAGSPSLPPMSPPQPCQSRAWPSSRPAFEAKRGKERDRDREKERERERKKEKERERERKRETRKTERDQKSAWVDIVDTNVTAATVPKPGVASSRPAFEAKRGKERDRDREKERERPEIGVGRYR